MNPLYKQLKPKSVLELATELARAFAAGEDVPDVDLLVTGRIYTGRIIGIDKHTVILAHGNYAHQTGLEASYIAASAITAISIRGLEISARRLTDGAVARTDTGNAPTRLALRRWIGNDFANAVKTAGLGVVIEADFDTVPEDKSALLNLKDLLGALKTALGALSADTLGADAIKALKRIEISHKADTDISYDKSESGLAMSVDLTRALPQNLSKQVESDLNPHL